MGSDDDYGRKPKGPLAPALGKAVKFWKQRSVPERVGLAVAGALLVRLGPRSSAPPCGRVALSGGPRPACPASSPALPRLLNPPVAPACGAPRPAPGRCCS